LALGEHDGVLVSNFEGNTVSMHTPPDATTSMKFEAGSGPYGLLALGANQVLSLDYYSDGISFLDLDTGTAETLPLERDGVPYANPTHAALSSDGASAWIVSSGTVGHLLEFNLQSRSVARALSIDGLSFGVAVVSGVFP
jgi:hypothetical protein